MIVVPWCIRKVMKAAVRWNPQRSISSYHWVNITVISSAHIQYTYFAPFTYISCNASSATSNIRFDIHEYKVNKAMAPFKLRFAKMSKSRSKESSSNSEECDDTMNPTPQMKSGSLETSRNSGIEVFGTSADFRTNPSHSPPPSYEHVLDEKRLRETTNQQQNTIDAGEDNVNILMAEGRILDGTKPEESCLVMRGGKLTINGPEILHKSSKELYRAVAKECGITCKMSDHCRCIDCQSHYFDCDYDKDEQGKTDGGLGAGTPMFISEAVMHGTACILL